MGTGRGKPYIVLAAVLVGLSCSNDDPRLEAQAYQHAELPFAAKVVKVGQCSLWRITDSVTGYYVYVAEGTEAGGVGCGVAVAR